MNIKVMTFNIQHCENFNSGEIDFEAYAKAIRDSGADIIGLNEVRGEGPDEGYAAQARILSSLTGLEYYFAEAIRFGGYLPYGNALLSRFPILCAHTLPVPDPPVRKYDGYYETRCLLKAELDVPGGLTVCVIHFGLNPDEHENAARTVLTNVCARRCILMGDFNVTPEDAIISGIADKMADTAAALPETPFTFPSDKPEMKIDYIFTSRDIRTVSSGVPQLVLSDHRPYTAVLSV